MRKLLIVFLCVILYQTTDAQPFTTLTEPKLLDFVQNHLFASYPIFGKEEQVKKWLTNAVEERRFIPNGTFSMVVKGWLCYHFKVDKQTFVERNGKDTIEHKLKKEDSYILVGGNENYTRSLKYLDYILYFETPETKNKALKYIGEQLELTHGQRTSDVDMSNPYYISITYTFREGTLNVVTQKGAKATNITLKLTLNSDLCVDAGIDNTWIPPLPPSVSENLLEVKKYALEHEVMQPTVYEHPSELPYPNVTSQRIITTDYTPNGTYNCDNRCLLFNGNTDYLNFSKQPIEGNMDFTFEAQIALPFGAVNPLSKGIAPDNCGGQFKRIFSLSSGPSMRIELGHCGGKLTILLVGTGDDCFTQIDGLLTNSGHLYHIALTRHKNELSVYFEGKRIFFKQKIKELNTKMTLIGGWQGMSEFYDGYMDELRIWTKGRSAEEISRNAYLSLTKGVGLVGSYSFDEGKPFGENQNITVPVNRAATPSNNLFFPKREDSWSRKADFSNYNCSYSRIHKPSDISLNPQSAKKYKNKGQEPDEVLALFIASLMRKDDV